MTHEELRQREYEYALRTGEEAIDTVLATLQRATENVKRYRESYSHLASGTDSSAKPEDALTWLANELASNVLSNCRMDLLVAAAARIGAMRPVK